MAVQRFRARPLLTESERGEGALALSKEKIRRPPLRRGHRRVGSILRISPKVSIPSFPYCHASTPPYLPGEPKFCHPGGAPPRVPFCSSCTPGPWATPGPPRTPQDPPRLPQDCPPIRPKPANLIQDHQTPHRPYFLSDRPLQKWYNNHRNTYIWFGVILNIRC